MSALEIHAFTEIPMDTIMIFVEELRLINVIPQEAAPLAKTSGGFHSTRR